jgi:voltage-gated potassium channel
MATTVTILVAFMYFVEDIDVISGVYFAIITGTTVGFGDISPKTPFGMMFVAGYIILSAFQFGGFIGLVSANFIEHTNKHKKGRITVKHDVYLGIAGYPEENKVRSIVREIRSSPVHGNKAIVCITDKLDEKPNWMEEMDVDFVKGITTSKDTLEKAGIYKMENILILAEDSNSIASDETTSSVILMCEKLNPNVRTVAESVRDEGELFEMCDVDLGVDVMNGRDLAHEILNPGAIELVNSLFSFDTPATQRNFVLTEKVIFSWREIVIKFMQQGATAIGYKPPNEYSSQKQPFNFSPKLGDTILPFTTIKYISDRRIDEINNFDAKT